MTIPATQLSSINMPFPESKKQKLIDALSHTPLADFPHASRVHSLRSFPPSCYVKREDELGFGISGTKLRKYLSLLPFILKEKPQEAVLIGSAYSNHVLSFAQLLRENGVQPILFLLGDEACTLQGNLLYSAMIAGQSNIRWIPRGMWHGIDQIAEEYVQERQKSGVKAVVIPKGANCAASLPGAVTLALDILRNEEELGISFEHIFIDSGTGITACGLLTAFAYLQKPTFLHIVQVAGNPLEFTETLAARKRDFEGWLGHAIEMPTQFKLYCPTNAPTFGAVNNTVFKTIAEIAQNEGFLTDPVFTGKLFYETRKILNAQTIAGNVLILHSGGGLGMTGFQRQLSEHVSS